MSPLALLLWTISILITVSKGQNNKAWILLEEPSMFQCRGVNNQFQIDEKDVTIRNSQGRQVHYLEAPGTYVLSIRNIRVKEPLPNLSGQIKEVLQVPIGVGNTLSWDFPYELMPEKKLIGYHCDKVSGAVLDGGKSYCRYCDLCMTSEEVDHVLNSNEHKYLPKVGSASEPDFDRICNQIGPKTYSMQRTISLPDKQELEKQANAQFTGLGGELKKKLNRGKGKLQTEMILMSSREPPATRDQVYAQSALCRCCLPGVNDLSCKLRLGGCDQDACMGEYAQKCLRGNTEKVGCYTVQFSYEVTDKPEEVKAFLKKNNYQDEYNDFGKAPSPSGGGSGGGTRSTGNGSNDQQRRCVNKIKEDRFKRLCEVRWQQHFCCSLCDGGC